MASELTANNRNISEVGVRMGKEHVMRRKTEANMGKKETTSHQVGHDVMVAFDMFPDTDNL